MILSRPVNELYVQRIVRGSHPTRPLDDPTDPTLGQHEHPVNLCARQPTLRVYRWPSLIETDESRTQDQSYGMVGPLPLGHQEILQFAISETLAICDFRNPRTFAIEIGDPKVGDNGKSKKRPIMQKSTKSHPNM
ncbi:hypothetical protein LXL04_025507 [Taraxacum kok-saghyz]